MTKIWVSSTNKAITNVLVEINNCQERTSSRAFFMKFHNNDTHCSVIIPNMDKKNLNP